MFLLVWGFSSHLHLQRIAPLIQSAWLVPSVLWTYYTILSCPGKYQLGSWNSCKFSKSSPISITIWPFLDTLWEKVMSFSKFLGHDLDWGISPILLFLTWFCFVPVFPEAPSSLFTSLESTVAYTTSALDGAQVHSCWDQLLTCSHYFNAGGQSKTKPFPKCTIQVLLKSNKKQHRSSLVPKASPWAWVGLWVSSFKH